MYLPKEKLEGFLYFEHNYHGDYKNPRDIIKVHRKKTTKGFFGRTKEVEFVDTYSFNRTITGEEIKASDLANRLYSQLNHLVEGKWHYIGEEQYKYIKENYPELLT